MHYVAFQGMYIRFLGLQFKENLFIYVLFICLFFDLALLLLYSLIVWGIAAPDNRHQICYSSVCGSVNKLQNQLTRGNLTRMQTQFVYKPCQQA